MKKKVVAAILAFVVGPAAIGGFLALRPDPAAARDVVVHLSPTCGCCHGWISYLRRQGFRVTHEEHEDMEAVKDRLGVPGDLRSCHSALIGGYVVEGHVPLPAIETLLKDRPDVVGIASPGMPSGSPGMNGSKEPNPIYSFGKQGSKFLGTY